MLLASCVRTPSEDEALKTAPLVQNQSNQKTYVYECINGFTFTARVDDENAYLFLPDKTARLANVPSASGVKYGTGNLDLSKVIPKNSVIYRLGSLL